MHENEFNRAVAKYLKQELERCGFRTLLVADGDTDVPLATRVQRANNAGADFYISIHANANTSQWGNWGGIETYTYPKGESLRIGKIIHKYLLQGTPLRDRGVKDGSWLYVIKRTKMPAVLVECGFMDNLKEAKLLLSDNYRRECAKEIAKGICEGFGVKYIEAPSAPKAPQKAPAKKPATPPKKTAPEIGKLVVVDADVLNIRSKPSWDKDAIAGQVKKGEAFRIVDVVYTKEGDKMYKTKYFYITASPKYVHVK